MIFSRFLVFTLLLVWSLPAVAKDAAAERHDWQRIDYPPIPIPGEEKEKMMVLVGSGGRNGEASHLRFDVLWSTGRNRGPLPKSIADASKLVVRLHLSDGKIVLPDPGPRPPSWIGAGGMGITWSLIYMFPWQRNEMEEAWIELALPDTTYWVELPYGFTRDPAAVLPSDAKRGEPVFPPTMKALGDRDHLVPWWRVNYDLGKIQNDWRLLLVMANPFDATAVATLYREDFQVGKSMFLWKRDQPKTAMEIRTAAGGVLSGRGTDIHLHEDGLRRSDGYAFNRNPQDGRDWGKVTIKVEDKTYQCTVPSSLFKYVHGVTDPENAKWLPRPKELGDR